MRTAVKKIPVPTGNEALILLAIHQGLVHPCFTEDIFEEYAAVLARPKFAFPPDEIAAALAMFHNQGELFQPEVSGPVSSDPADTKFLHCAQAAQADYIVTGNKRDFPDAPYGVTRVVVLTNCWIRLRSRCERSIDAASDKSGQGQTLPDERCP
jgi:putative PIN family toxin of toxin-antitoxin system